ncbi:hypothetical protein KCU65_g3870, partial [Aureobasidium melanogenum]
MSPVPFTMQLRSATARQSGKLVHHHEHITINGRRALKVHFNDAPGNPKSLTFLHQPRRGLKLKLRLGKVTPKTNTEATEAKELDEAQELAEAKELVELKKLVHHYEHLVLRNKRALRVHMNSDQGNPKTLTFIHQPRSGGLRLRLGKPLNTPLCLRLSGEQTRSIKDRLDRHSGQTNILTDADVSEKADLLLAAAEEQQMDGGEIKVEDIER